MVELSIFNIQIHFSCEIPQRHIGVYLLITLAVGPLRANPTKWSNTLKQFVGKKAPYQMFGRVLNKLEHHSQHFHTSVNLKLKTKSTKQNHMYKYSLFLVNWCQKWFEFFPNPPISILSIVEKLLAHHDAALLDHFVRLDVSTIVSISLRKPFNIYI